MRSLRSFNHFIALFLVLTLSGMPFLAGCGGSGGDGTQGAQVDQSKTDSEVSDWSQETNDTVTSTNDSLALITSGTRLLDNYDDAQVSTEEVTEQYCEKSVVKDGVPVTIVFGGNVMLDRGVEKAITNAGKGDYTFPWLKIADYLKAADISFVNLESIISDKGTYDWTKLVGPWFRANPKAVQGLTYAGVDVVSVANNHCFDYGKTGLEDSLANLTAAGIKYCGVGTYDEAYTPAYVYAKGKKVAFLAYTNQVYRSSIAAVSQVAAQDYTDWLGVKWPASWGAAWLNYNMLDKGIAKAKADGANIIVVTMHYGSDYDKTPSATQKEFAEYAMNQGADIVIGHGPNVTQPLAVWTAGGGTKYIAFALGNLIFDQYEILHPGVTKGMLLEVTWQDGAITNITPRYVKIDQGTWQPEADAAAGN